MIPSLTGLKEMLNTCEAYAVAEIRYVPFKVHWSYGVWLFCHSSAQELFILFRCQIDNEYYNGMGND